MKIKLSSLISLLLIATLSHANDPISRAIDELMHLSGAEKQFSNLPEQIIAGMQAGAAQQGGSLPPELTQKVQRAAAQAYNSNNIKQRVRQQLRQQLSVKDIKQLMEWLKSDTGRKITQAEEKASTPQAIAEAMRTGSSIQVSAQRQQLFKQLDQATDMSQNNIDIAMFTAVAVSTGMVAGLPVEQRPPHAQIQASIEQMRPNMTAAMRQQLQLMLAYTYRNISDAELNRYIDFYQSRSGQQYNRAMITGVRKALSDSALNFGDLLAQ